ncbi:MAG: ATP/GTP-binding protein [Nitrososphaeria archaeon]|jgi:GTPase SAR1 family protein
MNYIIITGLAGSGKSLLTQSLSESLEEDGWSVLKANFDPSAENLPYTPDFDIKEFVDSRTVLDRYGLGSNGSLLLSMDLLLANLNVISPVLESYDYDYAILDMPGQLEIFAFRTTGPILLNSIAQDKLIFFLSDVVVASDINNFLLLEMISRILALRMNATSIHVINKIDLDPDAEKRIREFERMARSQSQADVLQLNLFKAYRLMKKVAPASEVVFASAKTKENIWKLKAYVSRVFKGGEDKKA